MPAEPIGPHMTATPVGYGWIIIDGAGLRVGVVAGGLDHYTFSPSQLWLDAERLRAIADFLDRVTAERKARGGA